MDTQLASRSYTGAAWECLAARACGDAAMVSGLISVLLTFPSSAACTQGMRIASAWYFEQDAAPDPHGRWVSAACVDKDFWHCIVTYYRPSDRDWRNGGLYARERGLAIPVPPVTPAPPRKAPPPRAGAGPMPPATRPWGGAGPLPACGSTDNPGTDQVACISSGVQ